MNVSLRSMGYMCSGTNGIYWRGQKCQIHGGYPQISRFHLEPLMEGGQHLRSDVRAWCSAQKLRQAYLVLALHSMHPSLAVQHNIGTLMVCTQVETAGQALQRQ